MKKILLLILFLVLGKSIFSQNRPNAPQPTYLNDLVDTTNKIDREILAAIRNQTATIISSGSVVVTNTVKVSGVGTFSTYITNVPTVALQAGSNQSVTVLNPTSSSVTVSGSVTVLNPSVTVLNPTVTANAGTNLNTSALALDATLTNGTAKARITDGTNTNTIKTLSTQVTSSDYGLVTNSVIHGLTTGGGGGYVDVKVNPSGALVVDGSGSTNTVQDFTHDSLWNAIQQVKNQQISTNTKLTTLNTSVNNVQLSIDSMNYITSVQQSFTITQTNTASVTYTNTTAVIGTATSVTNAGMSFTMTAGTWRLIACKIITNNSLMHSLDLIITTAQITNMFDQTPLNPGGGSGLATFCGQVYARGGTVTDNNWGTNAMFLDAFQGAAVTTVSQTQNQVILPPITSGTQQFYLYLINRASQTKQAGDIWRIYTTWQKVD